MQIVDIGNGRRAPMEMVANQAHRKRLDSMFSAPVLGSIALNHGMNNQNLNALSKQRGFAIDDNMNLIYSNGHGRFQSVAPSFLEGQNKLITKDGGRIRYRDYVDNPGLAAQLLRIKSAESMFQPQNQLESHANARATQAMHNAFGIGNNVLNAEPASRSSKSDDKFDNPYLHKDGIHGVGDFFRGLGWEGNRQLHSPKEMAGNAATALLGEYMLAKAAAGAFVPRIAGAIGSRFGGSGGGNAIAEQAAALAGRLGLPAGTERLALNAPKAADELYWMPSAATRPGPASVLAERGGGTGQYNIGRPALQGLPSAERLALNPGSGPVPELFRMPAGPLRPSGPYSSLAARPLPFGPFGLPQIGYEPPLSLF